MTLSESVSIFVDDQLDYYKQWILDKPLIISHDHVNDLKLLQKIIYKMIVHFVKNYQAFKHLMPVSSEVEDILRMCEQRPYKAGTYRTDFVYDHANQVKIIEITSRFALNGMFLAAVINKVASQHKQTHFSDLGTESIYDDIFKHFEVHLSEVTSIHILFGEDKKNESKIYKSIFERIGKPVYSVNVSEIEENINEMESSWIISELAFDEILSIPSGTMEKLTRLNVTNDFRTIFLTHDKRFFDVLGNNSFQASVLSHDERAFFSKFYVPTYSYSPTSPIWHHASRNKSQWVVKPCALGKSQKVHAGIVTDSKDWEQIFQEEDLTEFVLQKWVDQTPIQGEINGVKYNDFVTGTLLFFDNNFFGFGDFRTSSYPVTNIKDHRKASSLILNDQPQKDFFNDYNLIC